MSELEKEEAIKRRVDAVDQGLESGAEQISQDFSQPQSIENNAYGSDIIKSENAASCDINNSESIVNFNDSTPTAF